MPNVHIWDKLEHSSSYFGLTVLLSLALIIQNKVKFIKKHPLLTALIIVSLYGALDELHQLFIPGRDCDFFDWCADFIGANLGILVVYLLMKYSRFKREATKNN